MLVYIIKSIGYTQKVIQLQRKKKYQNFTYISFINTALTLNVH